MARADWDRYEEGGHEYTHLHGPLAGYSTYCCERCSSLLIVRGDEAVLFHAPRASSSTPGRCHGHPKPKLGQDLKQKLKQLRDADHGFGAPSPARPQGSSPTCSRCGKELGMIGDEHPESECAVREVMDS